MFKKLRKFLLTTCFLLGVACGLTACSFAGGNHSTTVQPTNPPITENAVTIKTIKAVETPEAPVEEVVSLMSLRRYSAPVNLHANASETTNAATASSENNSTIKLLSNENEINYIVIYKSQTDITFTITLDNPEAYGIDALRVYCDDENAQIQVDGEYKPIAQESDGTRVINWASEDPYTKTYNIRTTSKDAINSFKVVDVRLAGHDTFQSKETNSTDLGNNELHIYKMDEDAYTLNVIENTFDYIKFNFNIKDEYKNIISNIKVDGLEMDEELGYWTLEESKNVSITYDYYLEEYGITVNRKDEEMIEVLSFSIPPLSNWSKYSPIYTQDDYWILYDDNGVKKYKSISILKIGIEFNYNVEVNVYYDNKLLTFITYECGSWSDSDESKYSDYIYSLEDIDFTKCDTRVSNFTVSDINNFLDKITLEINNSKYRINQIHFIEEPGEGYYFDSFELSLGE